MQTITHQLRASTSFIERRLGGASLSTLASDYAISESFAHRVLAAAHLAKNDMHNINENHINVKVRACLCCGFLIASPHNGVRMCQPCRDGVEPDDGEWWT